MEPAIGEIKQGCGFWRFPLQGLTKVKAEGELVRATHNILKLHRTAKDKGGGEEGARPQKQNRQAVCTHAGTTELRSSTLSRRRIPIGAGKVPTETSFSDTLLAPT